MQFKLFTLTALVAAVSAQNTTVVQNLTTALTSTPELSNLTIFVGLFPQLLTTLTTAKNITILAPSNTAFTKFLGSAGGDALKGNDSATIHALLTYHVLNGSYSAANVSATPAFIPTLLTDPKFSNVTGGQRVEAVLSGTTVTIISGGLSVSTVTKADIQFDGGIIHIIDNVLIPPQKVSTTATVGGLTSALTTANLVSTVELLKDITLFAPNNAAFTAIGSAVANLTTDQLAKILTLHVVNGTVAYSSTLSNTTITAVSGGKLNIAVYNGTVTVNGAKVVTPDILVANGVVHIIDSVLDPNSTAATNGNTTASAGFPGATSVSNTPFTSGVPAPTSTLSAKPTSTAASSAGAYAPMRTGAIGAAALFAAGGVWLNA